MRYAFIRTLIEEAEKNKKVMLLTGDLGFTVFERFREKFPEQFINVGVAEQNMMGIAAGLALSGKIVFAYSIASFATMRAFEQIRSDVIRQNLPVIVVGTGAGLCYSFGGTTHHAIEDISLMRSISGMIVLCPADPVEVAWAIRIAIKIKRPVYLRLGKQGEPVLYQKSPKLRLGKGRILRKGKDFVIFATGNIVFNALQTAEILFRKKIDCTVVSFHTIKPIDRSLIKKFSQKFSLFVTIEEHNIIGGLGSAVAEVLSEEKNKVSLICLGIPDRFITEIGSQRFLREKLGLTPEKIANKIHCLLKK